MALTPAHAVLPRPAIRSILARPFGDHLAIGVWPDVLLAVAFVGAAGVVRWPNLLIVPQFTTGGAGILMALDIADGRAFYLREISPYIGAPYIWLLALVYRLFGPSIGATMLVTWAIGALTVVPTYLLGREIGGRTVGSIAALLLATSPAHTVITSHVPLSHSVTPLVSTTVLWLLARAVRRADQDLARGGRLLAVAGLLAGLALQTHPTVAPLLAGAALGATLVHRQWLRTRWPAIALALAVLGYGTLLVYHVTSGFEIVADIRNKEARYRDAGHDDDSSVVQEVYPGNLGQLLLSSTRLISGAIEDREDAQEYLLDPWVLVPALLALAGLAVAARARAWWLVIGVMVAVFIMPAFNGKYRPLLDGRFLMPLLPVLLVAIGLAIVSAARVVARRTIGPDAAEWTGLRVARIGALALLLVGTALLAAKPLDALDELYESSLDDGISNVDYLATLTLLNADRHDDEAVLLDPLLNQVKTAGGGKASTNFSWLLAVSRIPSDVPAELPPPTTLAGRLAILHRTTANRLDDSMQLDALDGKRFTGKDSPSFRLYRIGSATDQRP